MALTSVLLPLFSDTLYSYKVALEGTSYNLKFRYNERMKLWLMDIYTEDNIAVLLGVTLVPNYPIALEYTLEDLSGGFWLEAVADTNTEQYKTYPEDLAKYYRLFYIYDDGE